MNILLGILIVFTIFYICTFCGYLSFNFIFGLRWKKIDLTNRIFGSFLFGSFSITAIIFILNFLYIPLVYPVFGLSLASSGYSLFYLKKINGFIFQNIRLLTKTDLIFAIIFFLVMIDIFNRATLISDGLFWWGFKARILASGPGLIRDYLSDNVFIWSHMDYPFYLPVLESWIYTYLGRVWEPYGAFFSPAFYGVLGLYVYLFIRKIASGFKGLILGIIFLFTPLLQEVSVLGYADLILSLFYLVSTLLLFRFIKTKNSIYLILSLFVVSGLFWIKKEGIILFGIYSVVFTLVCLRLKVKKFIWLLFISCIPVFLWLLLLKFYHVPSVDFVTPSLDYLKNNLQRIIEITVAMRRFLKFTPFWGLFWLLFALLCIYRIKKIKELSFMVLIFLTGIPLIVYPSLFIFSSWIPYYEHVRTSLPRLVLQVYPLAYMLFVMYFFNRYQEK